MDEDKKQEEIKRVYEEFTAEIAALKHAQSEITDKHKKEHE